MSDYQGPLRDFETGTGFANAKLSEILPTVRVARFVRMTDGLALLASSVRRMSLATLRSGTHETL